MLKASHLFYSYALALTVYQVFSKSVFLFFARNKNQTKNRKGKCVVGTECRKKDRAQNKEEEDTTQQGVLCAPGSKSELLQMQNYNMNEVCTVINVSTQKATVYI